MASRFDDLPLRRGAHPTRNDGMCAMEMVAWLAGEAHSDEPQCACPVLSAFVRACNDAMDDEARNRWLRPLVPILVNTRASAAVEKVRGWLVVDAVVRELLPARLRWLRRSDEANLLADLPPIRSVASAKAALRAIEHFAREHHATRWVLQRAVDGMPPARFVAGAVQVAKARQKGPSWPAVVALIERMVGAGAPQAADVTPVRVAENAV